MTRGKGGAGHAPGDKRIVDRGDKQGLQTVSLQVPDEAGEYLLFVYRISAEPRPIARIVVGK